MPTTQVTPTEDALLQGIADALLKARKIVVITGAGISTNSGIPDFRSENGLYSLIQAQFDAASRDIPTPQCLSTPDSGPDDLEPPPKRRRLSFEDSAICLPSEDSQPTSETWASGDERTWGRERNQSRFTRESSVRTRARPRQLREVETRSRDTTDPAARPAKSYERTPRSSAVRLTAAKRAKSSPPEEISQRAAGALRLETPTANLRRAESSSPTRNLLRNRGRSASPGRRRRSTANQANPAELRKASMFRASMQASEEGEAARSFASSPSRPREPWSGKGREASCSPFNPPPKQLVPSLDQLTTPRTVRSSSPLSPPPSVLSPTPLSYRRSNVSVPPQTRGSSPLSSSPLSSPPAHLFDSFEPRFKSRRQSSSAASTAASSDISDTPNSSNPGKSALPNIKGRDLFDASIWADPLRTSVFYTFATTLRKKVKDVQPTESHHFIGHLRNRGKLVRCYTQNIDQIEEKVGLSTSLQEGPGHRGRFSRRSTGASLAPSVAKTPQATVEGPAPSSQPEEKSKEPANSEEPAAAGGHLKVDGLGPLETQPRQPERKSNGVECVFLHGSLESLRCFLCGKICPWDEEGRAYETLSGRQPECPYCAGATAARQERGKRALGVGKLRPDIVLYGEEHPNAHLISPIVTHDLGLSPDLLLILGTSLKVHGLKVLVREFAKTIHGRGGKVVFVNFTKPPESSWGDIIDYWVQWDCDAWVSNLKERIPLLWLPPGTKLPKKKKEGSEKPRKRQSTTNEKTKQEASKSSGKPRLSAAPNATAPAARSRDSDKRAKPQKFAQSRKSTTVVKPTEPRVRVPASPEEEPQTRNNATPSGRKESQSPQESAQAVAMAAAQDRTAVVESAAVVEAAVVVEPTAVPEPAAVLDPAAVSETTTAAESIAAQESATAHEPMTVQDPTTVSELAAVHYPIRISEPAPAQELEAVWEPTTVQELSTAQEPVAAREPAITQNLMVTQPLAAVPQDLTVTPRGPAMNHPGPAMNHPHPGPAMNHPGPAMNHPHPGPAMNHPHLGPAMNHPGPAINHPHLGPAMNHPGPAMNHPHPGPAMNHPPPPMNPQGPMMALPGPTMIHPGPMMLLPGPTTASQDLAATQNPAVPQNTAVPQNAAAAHLFTDSVFQIKPMQTGTQEPKPNATWLTLPKARKSSPRIRNDKTSAAWFVWRIRQNLRRITSLPDPTAPVVHSVAKPKSQPGRPRKLPAPLPQTTLLQFAFPQPALNQPTLNIGGVAMDVPSVDSTEEKKPEGGMVVGEDVIMEEVGNVPEVSIGQAVKQYPRKRKRKTIDGVEVSWTGTNRSAVDKMPPRPRAEATQTPEIVDGSPVVPPAVLPDSDMPLAPVDMPSSTPPPMRSIPMPSAPHAKPPTLEPDHSTRGPLSDVPPNLRPGTQQKFDQPVFSCDALFRQLLEAPDWTPPRMPHLSFINSKEQEAAMALQGLRKGGM